MKIPDILGVIRRLACPSWTSLRGLGATKLLKTSIAWLVIVPIVVKALEGSPDKVCVSALFDPCLEVSLVLPFNWVVFYVAALVVTAGNLVFLWRCPKLIRSYENSVKKFKDAGQSIWDLSAHFFNLNPSREHAKSYTQYLKLDDVGRKDFLRKFAAEEKRSGNGLEVLKNYRNMINQDYFERFFLFVRLFDDEFCPLSRFVTNVCYVLDW